MLEPAAQAKAVVFGPNVSNFAHEAYVLLEAQAAVQVVQAAKLADVFARLAREPALRQRMGANARAAVERQRGATERTLSALARRAAAGCPRPEPR